MPVCLQEEVAQRLVDATPGRSNYRAMSVFTHFYSKPVYRFRCAAGWVGGQPWRVFVKSAC